MTQLCKLYSQGMLSRSVSDEARCIRQYHKESQEARDPSITSTPKIQSVGYAICGSSGSALLGVGVYDPLFEVQSHDGSFRSRALHQNCLKLPFA